VRAYDERGDVGGRLEVVVGLDHHLAVLAHDAARGERHVRELQRVGEVERRDAVRVHAVGVHQHAHRAPGAAERLHLARAGHALQLAFHRVRHALELVGAGGRVLAPERERHHRHVVDALGLHDRLADAEVGRDPVAVRLQGVVQAHERFRPRHADLELHGEHRHARARDREHVLDAAHLREHLLGGRRDQRLDVARGCPREGHQHVRHGDVDLRLFLARRHRHGEHAEQERHQREERGELRVLEEARDAARGAHVRPPASCPP
jgi:hypothetical protein